MESECKWIGIAPKPTEEAIKNLKVPYLKVLKAGITFFGNLSDDDRTDLELAGWKLQPNRQLRAT